MSTSTTAARRPLAAAFGALALAAALMLTGCGAGGGSESSADTADGKAGAAAPGLAEQPGARTADGDAENATGEKSGSGPGTGAGRTPTPAQSYIVRTATLTVEARNVSGAVAKARTLVEGSGGYVGNESTSLDEDGLEYSTITLRVPPDGYDRVLKDLSELGTLRNRKVDAQDVTGQVVDVESRLKTQRASVARVRELMDRATRLSDIVSLESELSSRQADLEALEAQQASLKARTGMATITLEVQEPPVKEAPQKKDDGFWATVGDALGSGWHAFYMTLRGILVALAVVAPFAALALLGYLGFRLLRRALPARRAVAAPPEPLPVPVPAPAGAGDGEAQPRE
ncbi:DUF4349 domain-containing protein [Actinacidiphila glaucinigra]|uniref:DUF4349 domain-containing protein n=1 Tax=Actinacidiphila glaucinigra TaxID=235986 RepID=UPI002DDC04A2|nr:DUF4349 domain-containing protein [Actinacidiphila glaucinigra]WSD59579.1 DUF4349 domain-containing protein [Actinacidiphila glaucinigra]